MGEAGAGVRAEGLSQLPRGHGKRMLIGAEQAQPRVQGQAAPTQSWDSGTSEQPPEIPHCSVEEVEAGRGGCSKPPDHEFHKKTWCLT